MTLLKALNTLGFAVGAGKVHKGYAGKIQEKAHCGKNPHPWK